MKIRLAALIVLAMPLALMAAPAQAEGDSRPCVSQVELADGPLVVKRKLEERWEVGKVGIRGAKPLPPEYAGLLPTAIGPVEIPSYSNFSRFVSWTYPMCGYSIDEAWVTATYRKRTAKAVFISSFQSGTLHGHPRVD